MDRDAAQEFATAWAQDWNDHDLDRIMRHFAEDVVFRSPVAAQLLDACDGTVCEDALRAYFAEGLCHILHLHFEVLDVYTGIDTIVINYCNRAGQLVNEILSFDGGLVVAGHGTYGPPPA